MPPTTQQQHFGSRLRDVLKERGYPNQSPTFLMREFNRHCATTHVTVHAARKWLIGEAIPTQEKLLVLSRWLGVGPEWLRFDGDEPDSVADPSLPTPRAVALAAAFDALPEAHRRLVEEFAQMLARVGETAR